VLYRRSLPTMLASMLLLTVLSDRQWLVRYDGTVPHDINISLRILPKLDAISRYGMKLSRTGGGESSAELEVTREVLHIKYKHS